MLKRDELQQQVWDVWSDRGFLLSLDPLTSLPDNDPLEQIAANLPDLAQTGHLRPVLDALPVMDFAALEHGDARVVERLLLLYNFFASAYVHTPPDSVPRIPASLAIPLVQLSRMVERPPILSYATMVLGNWKRINPNAPIELSNLQTLQTFTNLPDEHWFILVHIAIEASSAPILRGILDATSAIANDDSMAVQDTLRAINLGIAAVIKTFGQMPQGCDPDIYYRDIRPYMFGFTDVVYEGVPEYGGKPQSFRGGSGAQSSVIPALVAALGVRHESSGLMQHLEVMKDYMPLPHRQYLAHIDTSLIRDYVQNRPPLADAYNACLHQLMTFRRAHFYYARTYIFEKSTNPVGTGGTMFMDFLGKLIEETEAHLI